ncbi:MAG: DnaJ domain-containing protein [Alphaproteobacteria bacterium]|nr:DnaJ domain-containing protein [Alphaproteobacteria bacterium]
MGIYLVFAVVGAAVLAWLALRSTSSMNPAALSRTMRYASAVLLGLLAIATLYARLLPLALVFGALSFLVATDRLSFFGRWLRGGVGGFGGRHTKVTTGYFELDLDQETGSLAGVILRGPYAGRTLAGLSPQEGAELYHQCRTNDAPSATILEAYLDRLYGPRWREGSGGSDGEGFGPPMTVEEALAILGLSPGATQDDIREAHRRLMQQVHPDKGGSGYLAAQINAARDFLLGD